MIYDPVPYKVCPACEQSLPISEYWIAARRRDGHQTLCRTCSSLRCGRKPKVRFVPPEGFGWCSNCQSVLPCENFYKRTSLCKTCTNARRRKGKKPPRQSGELVACTKCDVRYPWLREFFGWSNLKGVVQPCKACINKRTRDKYAAETETVKARKDAWRRNNAVKLRIHAERRLARKRSLPDDLTDVQWLVCLEYWGNTCTYCGNLPGLLPGMNLTTDHVIPLTNDQCPGTVVGNIIPACQSCNASKSNRDVGDFLTDRFGPRRAKQILKRIQDYFDWVKQQDK